MNWLEKSNIKPPTKKNEDIDATRIKNLISSCEFVAVMLGFLQSSGFRMEE